MTLKIFMIFNQAGNACAGALPSHPQSWAILILYWLQQMFKVSDGCPPGGVFFFFFFKSEGKLWYKAWPDNPLCFASVFWDSMEMKPWLVHRGCLGRRRCQWRGIDNLPYAATYFSLSAEGDPKNSHFKCHWFSDSREEEKAPLFAGPSQIPHREKELNSC